MDRIDVERLRADTPGCAEVVHFNNAGAALPPRPVLDAVVEHLELEGRTGAYEAAEERADELAGVYDAVAGLIGARRDEIAITANATNAWQLSFSAVPFSRGDRILTTSSEYTSNALGFIAAARRHRVRVEVIPDARTGQLSLEALADMLDEGHVKLVAINHMPTHDGLINPAAEVGALARAAGALYLLDACQSVGQLDLDVTAIGAGMLSATGRKHLRGPRGLGFLYVRGDASEELDPPFSDERSVRWTGPEEMEPYSGARRFESWERSAALQLGLGAAARYAARIGMAEIERRDLELGVHLRGALAEIPGVTVLDRGARRSGIVTFVMDGVDPYVVKRRLRQRRINVTVSDQTYRYDAGPEGATPRVRASVHYYNTDEEIARLVGAVAELG
jgi:selenocysteine lyase/cysteine desulfurase